MTKEASAENPNGLILDAAAVTEYAMRMGYKKTHMTLIKTILLAFLAGAFVSFGCQTMIAALAGVEFTGPTKLLGGSFFATALMIIVLCGAELFTGNVLIVVAVLARRVFLWEYLLDMLIVWLANFLGTIVFGVLFWGSGVNGFKDSLNASGDAACHLAAAKAQLPEYQALLRGVGANMCVCFAVLMAYASKTVSGKVLACVFPIAAFAAIGFEHCIANMYFFTIATLLDCHGFSQKDAWPELILCSIGNIIGAVFLGVSYWYVNIHGTKLELKEVPHVEDGVFAHSSPNQASFCSAQQLSFSTYQAKGRSISEARQRRGGDTAGGGPSREPVDVTAHDGTDAAVPSAFREAGEPSTTTKVLAPDAETR